MVWHEVFEWVEANDGYEGDAPEMVKCLSSINVLTQRMMGIVKTK